MGVAALIDARSPGAGAGSEVRTPMAVAVIGGVIVSTALSLLVFWP